MNVFDRVFLNSSDTIERSYMESDAELDIAISRANKEYEFESGLIALSNNELFVESTDSNNENAFVKAVKSICNAIRKFIGDMIESISSIFDKRDNIDIEDYLKSETGNIQLETDVRKLEAIVDDEVRKGNKLLQMVSSATGISDEVIDGWIKTGTEKLAKLAPVLIPTAMAFGFKKIFSSAFKQNKKQIDDAEKEAMDGDNSDPKKNKQKTKILGHMSTMIRRVGGEFSKYSKVIRNIGKKVGD